MTTIPNEQRNLEQIAGLNQRGSTLSIVDLVNANTLNAEMAAYGLYIMAQGGSVLTAAMPGNAGKTTLLGCWLTGVPRNTQITTVTSPDMLDNLNSPPESQEVILVHELGAGPVYGYLWGRNARRAIGLIQPRRSLASCIHADTIDQLGGILTSPDLGVPKHEIGNIDLICFLQLDKIGDQYRRRVKTMFEAFGPAQEHQELFRWDTNRDTFTMLKTDRLHHRLADKTGKSVPGVEEELQSYQHLIVNLQKEGITDYREVRQRITELME